MATAQEIAAAYQAQYMPYVYAAIVEVIIITLLIVAIVVLYTWMKPVWSYNKCRNRPDRPWMLLFQKNKRVTPIQGKYFAETYEIEDGDNLLAFFKSDTDGYKLGQADLEVFYDGIDRATTPKIAVAIQTLKDLGYRNIGDVTAAINSGRLSTRDANDPTKSAVYMPLFTQFDPAVVTDFVKSKGAILKAYGDTKVNLERIGRNEKFYENPQIMGLAFIIIAACFGIGILKALHVF